MSAVIKPMTAHVHSKTTMTQYILRIMASSIFNLVIGNARAHTKHYETAAQPDALANLRCDISHCELEFNLAVLDTGLNSFCVTISLL